MIYKVDLSARFESSLPLKEVMQQLQIALIKCEFDFPTEIVIDNKYNKKFNIIEYDTFQLASIDE